MRFSTVQQKEIIEAESGRFVGYVIDAEVDESTGRIVAFLVSEPKKFLSFMNSEESVRKVSINDILVVGKDVILVKAIYD
ncbi:YlmC/YmxH family sporulation protein [Ureibacillus composti]|uniref:YlmC/YmxH family sporulation protein n=1 Tax=Lysinibacillus composti TaxID=720633 RepID=A0A3N9UHV0_9BACI|nr:YlmC/YmxH family sporulation protein [Lysinibacillus composti]MBM7608279.1 YlmC/YmxH family sporulation protein [Lysinibacillus composti]MDM5332647.1 YlmC/YmxH family sporulation protein [Ureibacillus composti]RQW75038.1 YlmC/YmxH family sporulation protein [Lysinibacillus composti]